MNKIIFILFLTLTLSCKKKIEEKQFVEDKVSLVTIYFCNEKVSTITSINCESFIENLKSWIFCLKIKDDEFIKKFNKYLSNPNNNEIPNFLDVRYRFEMENTIVCFDSFGYYSINGEIKGKLDKFHEVLDYINNNKKSSIRLEEFPIIEDEID